MKIRAIAISFLFFVVLFASGYVLLIHGGTGKADHDLFVFPKYQYGLADKVWDEIMVGIAKAEADYVRAVLRRGAHARSKPPGGSSCASGGALLKPGNSERRISEK